MLRSAFGCRACLSVFAVLGLVLGLIAEPASASRFIPVDSIQVNGPGLIVTVVDEEAVLKGARVWIESAEGALLTAGATGPDGNFTSALSPEVLAKGVSVTAYAPGFAPVTFLENISNRVRIELPRILPATYPIISGQLTGFDDEDGIGRAQVGIVAKALGIADLGQLDSSAFVSPINDTIPVYGSREIPSNIILPDQWFMLGIIPVHVNKPSYRLPVLPGSSDRYLALSGNVAAAQVLRALRDNVSEQMLDFLNVTRVGISEPVKVGLTDNRTRAMTVVNVEANERLTGHLDFKGSGYQNGKDIKHLVGALWEPFPGTFVPTDVKFTDGQGVRLKTIPAKQTRVLDLVVTADGYKFRGQWLDPEKGSIPKSTLSADFVFEGLDKPWSLSTTDTFHLMVAHVQNAFETSLGAQRADDKWVVVSPFRARIKLPGNAFNDLRSTLGKVNVVSVDLLQTRSGGYPFVQGEDAARDLSVMEKVIKEIK